MALGNPLAGLIGRRLLRQRSQKHGLAPGSVVHIGEARTHAVHLSLVRFGPDVFEQRPLSDAAEAVALRAAPGVKWITIDGVHDPSVIEALGAGFGIHALTQEDVANTTQRPKCEVFSTYLYFVLPMLTFEPAAQTLRAEQVSLVVGSDWVLCFLEDPGDLFEPVRERLRTGYGRVRATGADFLAFSLLDVIVDGYFGALEGIGDVIEALEAQVLADPDERVQQQILTVRRELIFMRRAAWPVREMLMQLERAAPPLIQEETRPFFRDTYDHAVQVIDVVESMRDLVSSLTDLYVSSLSNRMNEIMKVLTLVGTIFIPLTFISGVYGMNFDHMPELHARYGYPLVLAVMAAVALGMIFFFRRKRWI